MGRIENRTAGQSNRAAQAIGFVGNRSRAVFPTSAGIFAGGLTLFCVNQPGMSSPSAPVFAETLKAAVVSGGLLPVSRGPAPAQDQHQ